MTSRLSLVSALLCLALLAAAPAEAQVSYGAKVGLNFATADIQPQGNLEYRNRTDWHGGLLLVVAPEAPIGIQVEALYSVRGTGVKIGSSGTLDADYKLSFIDIPVLVRARAMPLGNGGVFLLAGPAIGIGVKSEIEQSGVSTDVGERFKNTEFGLTLGASLESAGFVLDGRYTHGLTNYATGVHPAVQEAKSRTFAISVGLRF